MVNYRLKSYASYPHWAKSARDFDERDMPLNKANKKSVTPTPTKSSQLRQAKATKEKKKFNSSGSLGKSNDDVMEDWIRIQSMERKQELQSLKHQNAELKKENEKLKDLLIKKKDQVEDLKTKVSNETENVENGTLDEKLNELNGFLATLRKEREQLISQVKELRTSKDAGDKQIEHLKQERGKQNTTLQQTADDLEKGKREIQNLYKMYEDMLREKEKERLTIQNENKLLVQNLKVKSKSMEALSTTPILSSKPVVIEELSTSRAPPTVTVELIPDFELGKGDRDDNIGRLELELQTLKQENEILSADYEKLRLKYNEKDFSCTHHEEENKHLTSKLELAVCKQGESVERLQSTLRTLTQENETIVADGEEMRSKFNEKDLACKELEKENKELSEKLDWKKDLCTNLEQKLNDVQGLVNRKNTEILSLSSHVELLTKESEESKTALDHLKELVNDEETQVSILYEKLHKQKIEIEKLKSDGNKKLRMLEEQLTQTRKQKEHFEDNAQTLQKQCDDLTAEINSSKSLKSQSPQGKEDVVVEVEENTLQTMQNELAFTEADDGSLQQIVDKQQVELTNLESHFKSEVNELQRAAESQEQVISKLQYDNQKLQKHTYELNGTILSQEEKLRQLNNENIILSDQLKEQKEHHTEMKQSHNSIIQHEKEDTKTLLQLHEQEIETYKNRLNAQEAHVSELLKTKEKDISSLDNQLTSLQAELDFKNRDYKNLTHECDRLRKFKEQEQFQRDEQESYILREIERVQHECKLQIASVEEDKDKQMTELITQQEERLQEVELEYEQLKSSELDSIRVEFKSQLDGLMYQRNELMVALKKMETLLLTRKIDDVKHADRVPVVNGKSDTQKNSLYEYMLKSFTEERRNQKDTNFDMLNMLSKLESKITQQYENLSTNNNVDLNSTWPQINQSKLPRRLSTGYNEHSNEMMKEELERARSEISVQLKDLDNVLLSNFDHRVSSPLRDSLNGSMYSEDGFSLHSIASSSPIPHAINRHYSSPSHSATSSVSPSHQYFKDSGLASDYSPTKPHFQQKQFKRLLESFGRLELKCRALESESVEYSNESWYKDLLAWKQRANARLTLLQQRVGGEAMFLKSVVFRPSDTEVRQIIAEVNDKYERFKEEGVL